MSESAFKIPKNSMLNSSGSGSQASFSTTQYKEPSSSERTWVTCFGFLPGQAEIILQYFKAMKGLALVDYEPKNDKNANWVHLKFKSQKDVAVALGESGQILELNGVKFMIGVVIFHEGDQFDAKNKASSDSAAPARAPGSENTKITASMVNNGGPKKVTSLWEKAAVWMMDM